MFRRRSRPRLVHRVREVFWPRAGWRRWGTYLLYRLKRMPGSPHAIAAGLAAGAAVSCMPLPGLHFLLGLALAFVTRGNILASAIGTAFGNPWTFPILWSIGNRIGTLLLPTSALPGPGVVPVEAGGVLDALLALDFAYLTGNILPAIYPTLIGSLPLGALVWIAVYLPIRSAVAAHREQRRRRRMADNGTDAAGG